VLLIAALCGAPAVGVAQLPAAATPPARTFTLHEFRTLRWLEGTWRGRLPNGRFFYERRTLVNDSTLTTTNYADSTLTSVTETGDLTFRGGVIASGGGRRMAISLDSAHVEFARGTSRVRFDRQPGGRWVATLSGVNPDGSPQRVVYHMERYGP
jgi:hypothetical protein